MDPTDLRRRFDFYPAENVRTALAHEIIRAKAHDLARVVNDIVPAGREQALAVTHIEEAMMWANAGIARNGGPAPEFDPDSYGTG